MKMRHGMCDEPNPPKCNTHPRILDQHGSSMIFLTNYLAQCPALFEEALREKAF